MKQVCLNNYLFFLKRAANSLISIYFVKFNYLNNILKFCKVPGEPTDFKLVKVTADTIELEWKPPRQDEQSAGSNVKGYEIQYFKVIDAADSSTMQTSESQIMKRKISYKRLKTTISTLEPNSL